MKSNYDSEIDAITIRWSETPIAESDEVQAGIILDYDQDGGVLGVEMLHASQKIGNFPQLISKFESDDIKARTIIRAELYAELRSETHRELRAEIRKEVESELRAKIYREMNRKSRSRDSQVTFTPRRRRHKSRSKNTEKF